jgi:xanthine dehydrogenase accessory factor
MTEKRNLFLRIPEFLGRDGEVCLAVLIKTGGSTPQLPGSAALFSGSGLLLGTLGGGILEAEAGKKAAGTLKSGGRRPLLLEIRLEAEFGEKNGAVCGGSAAVLIDPDVRESSAVFFEAKRSLLDRRPGVFLTLIEHPSSPEIRLSRRWVPENDFGNLDDIGLPGFDDEIRKAFMDGIPGLFSRVEREKDFLLFAEPVFPLPRLVIAGAGHIGQAVASLGGFLDFEVTVIDDRPEYANAGRFPDADRIVVQNIGRAVAEFPVDRDTYLVIVTRGHSCDADALRACVRSAAAYIGMIGSRRKVRLTREEFLKNGWASPEELERVRSPIGLEIGSKTVEEIAISIAAELVLVRSQKKGAEFRGYGT